MELHTPTIARAVPRNLTLAQLLGYEHFSIEAKLAFPPAWRRRSSFAPLLRLLRLLAAMFCFPSLRLFPFSNAISRNHSSASTPSARVAQFSDFEFRDSALPEDRSLPVGIAGLGLPGVNECAMFGAPAGACFDSRGARALRIPWLAQFALIWIERCFWRSWAVVWWRRTRRICGSPPGTSASE
jgi:hypothetical protein